MLEVQTLFEVGGVAIGAVCIPVHTLSGPVSPFAGETIFTGIDIHPAIIEDVVGCADGLKFLSREDGKVLPDRRFADNTDESIFERFSTVF